VGLALFVFAIIFAFATVGVAIFVRPRLWAIVPALLAVLLFVLSISTTVPAKNVGAVTSFGAPAGSLDAGYHTKKPWEKVTDIDGTAQTRKYNGDNCLYVRIGDGSRSCVQMTVRWQINADKGDTIYADFRSDDPTAQVGDDLVSPKIKAALQDTLGDYNPVASLQVVKADDAGTAEAVSFAPDLALLSTSLKTSLETKLKEAGDLAEVLSVDVTYVSISDNTQKQLDDFIKAVGATVVAGQEKETKHAQALANDELAASVAQPGILESRCLDAINAAIEKGYPLPAGGINCLGGSSAVVVPSGK
jgi:regulator of protease activity HflC (stomatin/prohibitin superfamily)